MNFLRSYKFQLLGLACVFVLFIFSVSVRQEKLELRMSPAHEWLTAHTLLTLEIWDEAGGPQAYGFNPVYTYSGKGNKRIAGLGGIEDEKGDLYYVSYPPFAFIFAYYSTHIIGGGNLASIRAIGLIIHLLCACLIYFIILKLRADQKDVFSIAAILGAALYLFSSGTLWMHGLVYFSDMLVQVFLMASIYLMIKLLKKDYKNQTILLSIIGLTTFLGVYTEWLALFFSLISGLFFLIYYFYKKDKSFLRGFFVIGICAALALGLTILQYSSIDGLDTLKEVSEARYELRSGHHVDSQVAQPSETTFTWHNPLSFSMIEKSINTNFAMAINFFALIFIFLVPIIIWKKTRTLIKMVKFKVIIIVTLLMSILLHYVLFFNFNAVHSFSNLKAGFFMILVIGTVASIIEETLSWKQNIGFSVVLLFLVIPRSVVDYKRFDNFYHEEDFSIPRIQSASMINKYQNPNTHVITNAFVSPSYMYWGHHNIFQVPDFSYVSGAMEYLESTDAHYFEHVGDTLISIKEVQLTDGIFSVVREIDISE